MTRRALLVILVVAGLARPAAAQSTAVLAWDYDAPTTEVATYTQTATIDGTPIPGTPTCAAKVGAATQTTCQLPIPTPAAGSHTVSVTAARNGITAETRLAGLNLANGPRNAVAPRVTVTVTVTVP